MSATPPGRDRLTVIGLLAVAGSMRAGAQPPKIVAFTNVTAVPMLENQVIPNQTVVVTGDRITAFGPVEDARACQRARRRSTGRASS